MARRTCTPTDQTASVSVSRNMSGSTSNNDDALSGPCSGTKNNVTLIITYNMTTSETGDGTATASVRYSTNGGGSWTTIDSASGGGSASDTDRRVSLGDGIDLSQVQVRAEGVAGVIVSGSASATSDITAWSLEWVFHAGVIIGG